MSLCRRLRAVGARVQRAQDFELIRCRRWRLGYRTGEFDLPAGVFLDLLARDAWMDGDDRHLFRLRVGREQRQIGDQPGRALGFHAELGTRVAAADMADRGDEIEFLDEAAL